MHDAFSNASDYSELEDDFLFLANEGQVALVPSDEVPQTIQRSDKDDNRDVHMFKNEEDDEERALREYREKMAALIPIAPTGSNFKTIFEGQKDLDANFEAFMDEEYDDGQIGEGADDADVKD